MWYSITRDSTNFNTLLYTNTDGSFPIEVTVYKQDPSSLTNYRIYTNKVAVQSTASIVLGPNAVYKISSKNTNTGSIVTEIIVNYEVLLKDIVETMVRVMSCDANRCCSDIKGREALLEETLLKFLSYFFINSEHFSKFLYPIGLCLNKENIQDTLCLVFSKKYLGRGDTTEIMEKAITYFYLSFYLSELSIGEKEKVDSFFKISDIEGCLDINMSCIEEKIKYFLVEKNIPYGVESNIDTEAITLLENQIKQLEIKLSLFQINFQDFKNSQSNLNFQPKLTMVFDIDHNIPRTNGLPSGSDVNWGDVALWKGSLYKYVEKTPSYGEWELLNITSVINNGQPRESYVYRLNRQYYLYNGTSQSLVQISEYSIASNEPINTTPNWVDTNNIGWSTSNTEYLPSSTGRYGFKEQRDMNTKSPTYNQTRWISTGNTQGGTLSTGLVYYGDSGTSPENFNNMSIEAIFNTTEATRNLLTVTGTTNNNFTVRMDGQIHYLLVPRDYVELVRAEFGSELISVLWDNLSMSGDYKTSNPGGMWQGKYYNVYFLYVPGGAVISDIRLTLKNK